MTVKQIHHRRDFLMHSGATLAGLAGITASLAVPRLASGQGSEKKDQTKGSEKVSPAEDLMREHGLLNRILLIYDYHIHLLDSRQNFDFTILASAADIIKRFVEDYHEKLEEGYLFPRFRKAGKLTDLVEVLLTQHEAGRRVTMEIRQLATAATGKEEAGRCKLAAALQTFIRMYRPHEAREDTVLFPAFHNIVSSNEYDALGEEFEKKEDQLFGEEGFFQVLDQVATLEKKLGIYELSQFTPK